MRVTKEVPIALKDIGYDAKTNQYYQDGIPMMSAMKVDHNAHHNRVSLPIVYEAIEWLDSKVVYVFVEIAVDGWRTVLFEDKGMDLDVIDILGVFPTRLSAYTAGLTIAIDYIKNKKG